MRTDKVDVESVRVIDPPLPLLPGAVEGNGHIARDLGAGAHRRSYWWVWLLIAAGLVMGGWYAYPGILAALGSTPGNARGKGMMKGAPVVVAAARNGDMPIYLDEIGTVTALNTVTVHTRVDGQLEKVAFEEGQFVHAGDLLAEIDPRPFQVQLAQAEGQLARDQAQWNNAKVDLRRYQDAGEAVSRQQLDTAAATVAQFDGNVRSDQGAIDSAKLNLKYCEVRSPLTGKIGLRSVDQGNIVHASDAGGLAVITQLQPISVVFSVSQEDVRKILEKMGSGEKLAALAYDRALTNKIASGELAAADSAIDPTTSQLRFKAIFANENHALYPNQFVNVRLLIDTRENVVIVPTAAVQISPEGTFVYVVKKEKAAGEAAPATQAGSTGDERSASAPQRIVEMRPVTIGDQQGDQTVITGGMEAGEVVVTDGVDKLVDGAKVTVGRTVATSQPKDAHTRTVAQTQTRTRSMNPSRQFILRPVATSLLMVAILLAGLVAYWQLPVSALPEVDYPTIQVLTFYPGANPDVMASSVTAPLERQFGQVPGLNQMTSTSSLGSSVITLQFSLSLNIDVAEQEVQASINASGTYLPRNLPNPPIYSKTNPADTPIITLALTSKTLPLSKVEDAADTRLAQKISQLPGVGLVSISGGQKPAVRIQANPMALASIGMNLDDLRTAIAGANVNQAKGNLDGKSQSYTIGANDQLLTSADYRPLIVAYNHGVPVRLSDVATVVDSAENVEQAAWMNDVPAVIVNIQRQPGANIISVVDRVKALLPQLKTALPASVDVNILTDRTVTIRASVADVRDEMILTIGLVVMVIFLFLRNVAATIIPSVAVPLSLIGTFAVMYMLGYSLNNLTLMALTISTGFVVDDAIVMIENIIRYIEEGERPLAAALKGAGQIGFTIVSLSVSLIAVLIPLLFMPDIVGRLFREFAVTLSVTIVVSAVVSLTLTPMMCALLLRHTPASEQGRLFRASERAFEGIIAFYGRTLRIVLRHQYTTLLVAIGTVVLTVWLFILIPKGFFPVQDTGVILGISEAPQTISFAAMSQRQQALVDVILKDPAVANLSSFIGIDGTNTTMNSGRLQINLKPQPDTYVEQFIHFMNHEPQQKAGESREVSASDVIRRLQTQLENVEGITLFMQPVQDLTVEDRVSRTQYQYSLEDADANELGQWVPEFVKKLQGLPQLADVASDQQDDGLQVQLVIDRDMASRFGITPQNIDDALYDAFGQRQVSTMFTQLNQYHVVLEATPRLQTKPRDLDHIYIKTVSSGEVPLSAFTKMEQKSTPLSVNHQGQFPVVSVSFNLMPGTSLGEAVRAVNAVRDEIGMPASIQTAFQGTAAAFEASLQNEWLLILAAVVTVYIVLGVLYESYIHPITILSTLPSAAVGALLSLLFVHYDFSVIALIGIILLLGIVKKNAIMMIDFALDAQRNEGKSALDAIFQACLLRFRPILMTTMAALLAGIPLALGTGVGSELRKPLGVTMVGGLIFSQVLTLYTTPVIYLTFDAIATWFGKSSETGAATPGDEAEGASVGEPAAAGGGAA